MEEIHPMQQFLKDIKLEHLWPLFESNGVVDMELDLPNISESLLKDDLGIQLAPTRLRILSATKRYLARKGVDSLPCDENTTETAGVTPDGEWQILDVIKLAVPSCKHSSMILKRQCDQLKEILTADDATSFLEGIKQFKGPTGKTKPVATTRSVCVLLQRLVEISTYEKGVISFLKSPEGCVFASGVDIRRIEQLDDPNKVNPQKWTTRMIEKSIERGKGKAWDLTDIVGVKGNTSARLLNCVFNGQYKYPIWIKPSVACLCSNGKAWVDQLIEDYQNSIRLQALCEKKRKTMSSPEHNNT